MSDRKWPDHKPKKKRCPCFRCAGERATFFWLEAVRWREWVRMGRPPLWEGSSPPP